MSKQIKMINGRWVAELEQKVNEFIKDKDVIDIRYRYHEVANGNPYHTFMIIYEVNV